MSGGRTTSRVLMVEPLGFYPNEETLPDNTFQQDLENESLGEVEQSAYKQFHTLVALLKEHHVNVHVFTPAPECISPDAVFPSHWFSTHLQLGGVHVVYPMRSPKRRTERCKNIRNFLRKRYPTCIDLTAYDSRGEYLESQGSLVFDRLTRVAYVSSSTRSSERLAERWAQLLGYRLVFFDASDFDGRPIYHTSALMSIGDGFIVICAEAIAPESLKILRGYMSESGRELIEISRSQMMDFCGYTAQLGTSVEKIIVMSKTAYQSFNPKQLAVLEKYGKIIYSDISTIEKYGGCSVQSMIGELV